VRRRRRGCALLAGVTITAAFGLVAPGVAVNPAHAETVGEARAAVAAAQARVALLRPRVDRALRAYDASLGDLAAGVSRSIQADQAADGAAALARQQHRTAGARVRALYMSGGTTALVASVLAASDARDAVARMVSVRRLVQGGTVVADAGASRSRRLSHRATALEAAADAGAVRASDVARHHTRLTAALAQAHAEVATLGQRAADLAEAAALLAQVAALDAAADEAGAKRVASAAPTRVPPTFRRLYVDAARTCRGMSWTLLAAVGQVESGHGAYPGTSYAGARGPMQFMPATFAAYGVDGDADGDVDIDDPADAVFSAARYLCANGAGRGGPALARAVWHYNHAEWYVALVLKLAAKYAQADNA
jgi:hypothetical protein